MVTCNNCTQEFIEVEKPYYPQRPESGTYRVFMKEPDKSNGCYGRGCRDSDGYGLDHLPECCGNKQDHICTYYFYLKSRIFDTFRPQSQWDTNEDSNGRTHYTLRDVDLSLSRHARLGPTISRHMIPRTCRYCFQLISAGEPRIRLTNTISYHPNCFTLHVLFVKQVIEESLRKFINSSRVGIANAN